MKIMMNKYYIKKEIKDKVIIYFTIADKNCNQELKIIILILKKL